MTDTIVALIPVFLALVALAKVYVELRYTRTERDAIIRGVHKHREDAPAMGERLKDRIKDETKTARIESRVAKAVDRVKGEME